MAKPIISVADIEITEGNYDDTTANVVLTLSQKATKNIKILYKTVDGSATLADEDYNEKSGAITFKAGETTKNIKIKILGDYSIEGNEYFSLELTNKSSAVAKLKQKVVDITILDNDEEREVITPIVENTDVIIQEVSIPTIRGTDTQLSESEMLNAKTKIGNGADTLEDMYFYKGDFFSSKLLSGERQVFHFQDVHKYNPFSNGMILAVSNDDIVKGVPDTLLKLFNSKGELIYENDDVNDFATINSFNRNEMFYSTSWTLTDSVIAIDKLDLNKLTDVNATGADFYLSVESSPNANELYDHGYFRVGIY